MVHLNARGERSKGQPQELPSELSGLELPSVLYESEGKKDGKTAQKSQPGFAGALALRLSLTLIGVAVVVICSLRSQSILLLRSLDSSINVQTGAQRRRFPDTRPLHVRLYDGVAMNALPSDNSFHAFKNATALWRSLVTQELPQRPLARLDSKWLILSEEDADLQTVRLGRNFQRAIDNNGFHVLLQMMPGERAGRSEAERSEAAFQHWSRMANSAWRDRVSLLNTTTMASLPHASKARCMDGKPCGSWRNIAYAYAIEHGAKVVYDFVLSAQPQAQNSGQRTRTDGRVEQSGQVTMPTTTFTDLELATDWTVMLPQPYQAIRPPKQSNGRERKRSGNDTVRLPASQAPVRHEAAQRDDTYISAAIQIHCIPDDSGGAMAKGDCGVDDAAAPPLGHDALSARSLSGVHARIVEHDAL